jgi:multiple sugar transport system permease protein
MPFMFAPIVIAYQWRLLFNDQHGIINYALMSIGIIQQKIAWLGDVKTAMMSVIVADVWFTTPFVTLLLLGGLQSLPLEVYEAAEIDGANGWQQFWSVTLPMMRPIVRAAVLLRTMDAVKTFDLVYIMTNGGPGLRTEMIMTHSYKVAFITFRLGIASAIAIVGLIIMLIFCGLILFIFKERIQSRV